MEKQNLEKVWPKSGVSKDFDDEPLCCCEYYDRTNERYHILECCCNCVEFDESVERLVCCRSIEKKYYNGMLLTFQDRLRIPWRGGAKQISLDAMLPIFFIPFVLGIAAINFYSAVIILVGTSGFLGYSYHYLKQKPMYRSRFFFMWIFWSAIYMLVLFEITVPLLEILPEENYILMFFVAATTFCFHKTRSRAHQNVVVQSLASEDDLPDIAEEQISVLIENEEIPEHHHPNICQHCRKYVPPRSFHCLTCQSCIIRRSHHSFWLDCCIGASNHRYYYLGLWFAELALLLGTNLTLTSVCHPKLIFTIFGIHILIPDDCTEVFDQYEMSLAFTIAIYSIIITIFLLFNIIMQTYLIAKGITLSEWENGQSGNRKSILWNFRSFLF